METGAHPGGSSDPAVNVRFGPFELNLRAGELHKEGHRIRLQEQPFQILRMLLESPGEVVSREEIRQHLWPDDTVVEFDHSINVAVKRLRDALRDSSEKPRYIETVARRGYRFIGRSQSMAQMRAALEPISERVEEIQPSIAVLPFVNMSADKENEYFSDGLAEEILNLIAKIPGLKVIARTSSFSFRGKEQDVRKIAETLGVGHILEGSVRRVGNRLRVSAQLIHAADGSHLWSERYDRDLTDVFAIQDEIAQAISHALQVRLAPRAQVINTEAYQWYLKGQYFRLRFTPQSLAKAKECFEQALAIDPNYAAAHSGLAIYYGALGGVFIRPFGEVAPMAKFSAEKALALDPGNCEAHSVLGLVAGGFDYNWKLADKHYHKSMAVEPVPPSMRHRYAVYYLIPMGKFGDAMEQCRLALETDPVSIQLHNGMAYSLYQAKQYREAIEYASKALEIDASFYHTWFRMGLAQIGAGLPQEAISSFKQVLELAPWFAPGTAGLAAAYHQAGERGLSQKWARNIAGPGRQIAAGVYYATIGEAEAMIDALEAAYRQRDFMLPFLGPFCDPYRADRRFQALLAKMNLADAA